MKRSILLTFVAVAIATAGLVIWLNAKTPVKPEVEQSITVQQAVSILEEGGAVIEFDNGLPVALSAHTKDSDDSTLRLTPDNVSLIAHLSSLQRLDLSGTELNDTNLKLLTSLHNLRCLSIGGTSITAAGYKVLGSFPSLEQLDVGGNRIDDEGFQQLSYCRKLTHLNIGGTEATNNGLAHIGQLKTLQWLCIGFNKKITDEGLEKLARLELLILRMDMTSIRGHVFDQLASRRTLHSLDVQYTEFDDLGAKALSVYEKLMYLDAANTAVTDAGIEALQKIKTLKALILRDTKVTDASVPVLLGFPNLTLLGVFDTKISEEGIAELWQAKPRRAVGYVGYKFTLDKNAQNRP